MSFVYGLLSNVLANLVFWLGLGAIAYFWSGLTQRRFLKFFGLTTPGRVAVVLSNVWSAATGKRSVGFTVSQHELLASQSVATIFSSAPLRLPELVKGLVDSIWLRREIRMETVISPPLYEQEMYRLAIVLGATARNSARRQFVEKGWPTALLAHETPEGAGIVDSDEVHEVVIRRANGDKQVVKSSLGVAIIERMDLPAASGTVFFCCGGRADSTRGAAEYLVRHWRDLYREFGADPFVVCLAFPMPKIYPTEYVEPNVVAKFRP